MTTTTTTTTRWRVDLRCETDSYRGIIYPRKVVEAGSQDAAVALAREWAQAQGYTVLGVYGDVTRVWPEAYEDGLTDHDLDRLDGHGWGTGRAQ